MARQGYKEWWSPQGGSRQSKGLLYPLLLPGKQLVLHLGTEWLAHGHSPSANTTAMDVEG